MVCDVWCGCVVVMVGFVCIVVDVWWGVGEGEDGLYGMCWILCNCCEL